MKAFRVTMPVIIFLFAFMCVNFIQEAPVLAKAVTPVPDNIVISPLSATVVVGKKVNFTATVYASNGKKISGVKLDWSLTSDVGCSISQSGVLNASGATPGTYSSLVKVAVDANSAISAEAQVNIIAKPFTGGVFIGTQECTDGCEGAVPGELAIHATATSFKALELDGDGSSLQQFSGTIDKNGNVSATVNSNHGPVHIIGSVTFSGGIATGLSGTWSQSDRLGTWTTDVATATARRSKSRHMVRDRGTHEAIW